MSSNVIRDKSFAFALRMIKLNQVLAEQNEYVLSRQLLKSGTAIGAMVRESEHAESKADFIHKMSIAQKEANETEYWIELLHQSAYINQSSYESIQPEIAEIKKLLASILISSKRSVQ